MAGTVESSAQMRAFRSMFKHSHANGVVVKRIDRNILECLQPKEKNAPSGFDSPRNSSNKGSFQFGDFQRIQKVIFKKAVFL